MYIPYVYLKMVTYQNVTPHLLASLVKTRNLVEYRASENVTQMIWKPTVNIVNINLQKFSTSQSCKRLALYSPVDFFQVSTS